MTTETSPPLTSLSEAQRTQALERFALLRPALEGQISQTQLARDQQISLSTIQRWIKQYREKGLAGLAHARRSDTGKSRRLAASTITLIESKEFTASSARVHQSEACTSVWKGKRTVCRLCPTSPSVLPS